MKKRLLLLLTGAILLQSLAGCTGNPLEESSEPYTEPTPQAEYDPARPTHLTVAAYEEDPQRNEVLRQIADKFEYDHPNVTIEIEAFPMDLDEGMQRLSAQEEIDIFEVNDHTATAFDNEGFSADLNSYIMGWEEGYSLTIAAKWAMYFGSVDRAFFIPSEIYTKALYYRADLLAEEELSIPRFFSTVLSSGEQLQESGKVDYGFVMPLNETDRYQIADYFIWSTIGLGRIANVGAAYYVRDDSPETIFSLKGAEEALYTMKTMYDRLGPASALSMDDGEVMKAFMEEEAFMVLSDSRSLKDYEKRGADGNWVDGTVADPPPDTGETGESPSQARSEAEEGEALPEEGGMKPQDWVVYPMPLGDGDPNIGILSNEYRGWSIAENAPDQETAAAFLLYLSNSDNNTYLANLRGAIPIHSDAIELDSYFSDSHFSGYQLLADRAAIGLYHYVQPPKAYRCFTDYEGMANERYEDFLKGEVDAKTLLAELDAFWREAYETEGQRWASVPVIQEESSMESES